MDGLDNLIQEQLRLNHMLEDDIRAVVDIFSQHAKKSDPSLSKDDVSTMALPADDDNSVHAWLQDVIMKMKEPWDDEVKPSQDPQPPQPKCGTPLDSAGKIDSDPRVSAMATLYERQMKSKMNREKRLMQEKDKRQASDVASCTFSPRINNISRRIVAGSAPGWEASKGRERNGQASFDALGWKLGWDERRTPTKSSPPQKKIGYSGRMDDFGDRLYEQAMRLKVLKCERAKLQDEEDRQSRQFVARRYRSTSPSVYRDGIRGAPLWYPSKSEEFVKPSEPPSPSLDWPEFVDRQENFIRRREEKLKVEREQQSKHKAAPMSPGSRRILHNNGLQSSVQNDVQDATFNDWKARSRSLPRSEGRPRILRCSSVVRHKASDQAKDDAASVSYRPKITARAARRQPSSIAALHDGGRSRRNAWQAEQRLLREEEEMQEMTLRPSISPSSYHRTSLIHQNPDAFVARWRTKQDLLEEKRRTVEKERAEAELRECTFKPRLNKTLPVFVLKKPVRSLAEHSIEHFEPNASRVFLHGISSQGARGSERPEKSISSTMFPQVHSEASLVNCRPGQPIARTNQLQSEKDETLLKALELLNDVDAFLATAAAKTN